MRAAVAVAVLAPPAFLMGTLFPAGLRRLASGDPALVAWAWAGNGFASVLGAPAAALIALEVGTPALFALAGAAYLLAAALLRSAARTP